MRKILSLILVSVFLIGTIVGCSTAGATETTKTPVDGTTASTTGSEQTPTEAKVLKVGFSMSSKEGVIYQAFEDYMIKAGKESPTQKVEIMVTVAEGDAGKQAKDIEDLISKKPDAMIIMAHDSKAIVASIKACEDAGIPVLTYNRPETPDATTKPNGTVMLDSTAQGYESCKALFTKMNADGIVGKDIKIINVLGALNDENAVNRDKGMKKACEEFGVTILQDVPTDWNPDKALSGLSAAYQSFPDANALFIPSDFLMAGIQTAMERSNKWFPYGTEGHVYFASCDCFPAGIQATKDKYIDVNAAFDIWGMSTKAIEYVVKLANGEKIDPVYVSITPPVVTPDNLDTLPGIWGNEYTE